MTNSKERRPTPFEKLEWDPIFHAVGLDSDEKIDRLNRILVVHLLVDRLLTLLVAAKLAANFEPKESPPDVGKIIADIALLPVPSRLDRASTLGLLTAPIAENILEINRVRNRLVHFKAKGGKSGWDVDEVEEIASQDACDRCTQKGIEAVQALMRTLKL
jgi:hypothetical protein